MFIKFYLIFFLIFNYLLLLSSSLIGIDEIRFNSTSESLIILNWCCGVGPFPNNCRTLLPDQAKYAHTKKLMAPIRAHALLASYLVLRSNLLLKFAIANTHDDHMSNHRNFDPLAISIRTIPDVKTQWSYEEWNNCMEIFMIPYNYEIVTLNLELQMIYCSVPKNTWTNIKHYENLRKCDC
jgi:hypothetical protein